ncbi:hypothetical protein PR048_032565 [Dryococelus australis]|uniref:Uncharacterized protein n=1 Tax=Dryococelus australis TaxID=614101 RepID=A0ABQ9G2K6_9NEOP|nr:hypothetical protein PR048_032565 [Dryococelus australis]
MPTHPLIYLTRSHCLPIGYSFPNQHATDYCSSYRELLLHFSQQAPEVALYLLPHLPTSQLTFQTEDLAAILCEPLGENMKGVTGREASRRLLLLTSLLLLLLLVCHHEVSVHNKDALFVRVRYPRLQLAAFNGGHQVYLARGESPQHDARYTEVDGVADVGFAVLVRAPAVEDNEPGRVGAELLHQPFPANAQFHHRRAVRVVSRGHRRREGLIRSQALRLNNAARAPTDDGGKLTQRHTSYTKPRPHPSALAVTQFLRSTQQPRPSSPPCVSTLGFFQSRPCTFICSRLPPLISPPDPYLKGHVTRPADQWRRVTEAIMEQRRNAKAGRTEDHRENPPTSGIVRCEFLTRESWDPGIEHSSPWSEASSLTSTPPRPELLKLIKINAENNHNSADVVESSFTGVEPLTALPLTTDSTSPGGAQRTRPLRAGTAEVGAEPEPRQNPQPVALLSQNWLSEHQTPRRPWCEVENPEVLLYWAVLPSGLIVQIIIHSISSNLVAGVREFCQTDIEVHEVQATIRCSLTESRGVEVTQIKAVHDAATAKCSCSCHSTRVDSCTADVCSRSSKECAFTSPGDETRAKVEVLEGQSDEQYLTDCKYACHKVKKNSREKKKTRRELKLIVDLMTKLAVEGEQTAHSQHSGVNQVRVLNDLCMRNCWPPPRYSKCRDFPTQVKCVCSGPAIEFVKWDTCGSSTTIVFFRHGTNSTIDFFGWDTCSSAAIDDFVKASLLLLYLFGSETWGEDYVVLSQSGPASVQYKVKRGPT